MIVDQHQLKSNDVTTMCSLLSNIHTTMRGVIVCFKIKFKSDTNSNDDLIHCGLCWNGRTRHNLLLFCPAHLRIILQQVDMFKVVLCFRIWKRLRLWARARNKSVPSVNKAKATMQTMCCFYDSWQRKCNTTTHVAFCMCVANTTYIH